MGYFDKGLFDFLSELKANNTRPWFQANKDRFEQDVKEPYLDVISAVRRSVNMPLVAYQVSGEYSMLEAAARNGWLDHDRAVLESLTSIKRAGADLIITYYAEKLAKLLAE